MSREEILAKVNTIFADAFDRDDLVITYETKSEDIEEWDSLMQMNLIEMIEDEFSIRFEMNEVTNMKDVGAMIDIIASRV